MSSDVKASVFGWIIALLAVVVICTIFPPAILLMFVVAPKAFSKLVQLFADFVADVKKNWNGPQDQSKRSETAERRR